MDNGISAAAVDQFETEWQFDASDLEPVREWFLRLAGTGGPAPVAPDANEPLPALPDKRELARAGRKGAGEAPEPPELTVGVSRARENLDLYLDTPDWKVFRAGYALRIRTAQGRSEATLKELRPPEDGRAVRREITQPIEREGSEIQRSAAHAPGPPSAAEPDSEPAALLDRLFQANGPVSDRLRLILHPQELRAIAAIRTHRECFALVRDGVTEGEATLDHSALVERPDPVGDLGAKPRGGRRHGVPLETKRGLPPAENGAKRARELLRVEIEATGEPASLIDFVNRLKEAVSLVEAGESKFEWALSAEGHDPTRKRDLGPTEPDPAMTLGEVALAVLRKQYAALLWHEPGTRLGDDPEHLHDMRVASRRMRAALRLFTDALPPGTHWRQELRLLAQTLGEVRDLDVRIQQMEEWARQLITATERDLDPVLDLLRERRQAARVEMIRLLDSRRFLLLRDAVERQLQGGMRLRRPAASLPIRAAGPILIRTGRRKFMKTAKGLEVSSPAPSYHAARIRGKRLRYALEFLQPIYGPPARALIEALRDIQDILGLHQDDQVSMAFLRRLIAEEGDSLPEPARRAAAEMAQLHAARARRLREEFPAALRKLEGKRWKKWKRAAREASRELADDLIGNASVQLSSGRLRGGRTTPPSAAAPDPHPDPAAPRHGTEPVLPAAGGDGSATTGGEAVAGTEE